MAVTHAHVESIETAVPSEPQTGTFRIYLGLYEASEERAFSHAQARPAAIAFALLTLAGLALSIPYWQALGLLH
jgi:hypothetical protein